MRFLCSTSFSSRSYFCRSSLGSRALFRRAPPSSPTDKPLVQHSRLVRDLDSLMAQSHRKNKKTPKTTKNYELGGAVIAPALCSALNSSFPEYFSQVTKPPIVVQKTSKPKTFHRQHSPRKRRWESQGYSARSVGDHGRLPSVDPTICPPDASSNLAPLPKLVL